MKLLLPKINFILLSCFFGGLLHIISAHSSPFSFWQHDKKPIIANYNNIAVLLPFKGQLNYTSKAIKQGIIAAFYQDELHLKYKNINFYNLNNYENVKIAYQEAIKNGADIVIGPLTKENIEEINSIGKLVIPVLALNQIENSQKPYAEKLYQMAISPKDEIMQVLQQAKSEKNKKAILIYPENAWGNRLSNYFIDYWQELDEEILDKTSYLENKELPYKVKEILKITSSEDRISKIKKLLQIKNIDSQIRRRQDIDAIFLVANPNQARQIIPLLAFYFAGNLPIYAPSSVYDGNNNTNLLKDINGTTLCDIPRAINSNDSNNAIYDSLKNEITHNQKYFRFYALGIDAYNILPHLQKDGYIYNGAIGNLFLSDNNILSRYLSCFKVENNKLKILNH